MKGLSLKRKKKHSCNNPFKLQVGGSIYTIPIDPNKEDFSTPESYPYDVKAAREFGTISAKRKQLVYDPNKIEELKKSDKALDDAYDRALDEYRIRMGKPVTADVPAVIDSKSSSPNSYPYDRHWHSQMENLNYYNERHNELGTPKNDRENYEYWQNALEKNYFDRLSDPTIPVLEFTHRAPVKYQRGGNTSTREGLSDYDQIMQAVQGSGLVPIQTERGETAKLPNGTFVEVSPNVKHEQMNDVHVSDIFPEDTYVFSDHKSVRIPKKLAEKVVLGVTPITYEDGKKVKEPKAITLASKYFGSKKHMTPAELSKAIDNRFKLIDRPDDTIAAKTNLMQLDGRSRDMEYAVMLNELMKELTNPQSQGSVEQAAQVPEGYRYGSSIKKYQDGDNVPGAAGDELMSEYQKILENLRNEKDLTKAPYEFGALPALGLAAQTALGSLGIASQRADDPYFNTSTGTVDKMFPEQSADAYLADLDRQTAAGLSGTLSRVKQMGLSPQNFANYAALSVANNAGGSAKILNDIRNYNLNKNAEAVKFRRNEDFTNYQTSLRNASNRNRKNASAFSLAAQGLSRGVTNAQEAKLYVDQYNANKTNNILQALQAMLMTKMLK